MADAKVENVPVSEAPAADAPAKESAPASAPADAKAGEATAGEVAKDAHKAEEAGKPDEPKKEDPKVEEAKVEDPKSEAEPSGESPVQKLGGRLPAIMEKAGWKEMWNVPLVDAGDVPTSIVLQKFINANNGDVDGAEKQLTAALEWRKKVNPNELITKAFNKAKFEGLGYVTTHKKGDRQLVVTWNIYGEVKDFKATFGDVDEFIQWRAALMELGVHKLNLPTATVPIPAGGEDPYQMVQVHDYLNVSFFRMDPHVKAASKETISQFSTAYPELLSHKYFVNVPAVMGWVFGVMKLFLSPATLKKFHPMGSGASLFGDVQCDAESFPKEYGGKGKAVSEGEAVRLEEVPGKKEEEAAAA